MADKPVKINKSSDRKRFIKLPIEVAKLNKEFFTTYLKKDGTEVLQCNLTLQLLPDGTVDGYGNLGMITQDVPQELALKNKELRGEIVGNGCEFPPKDYEEFVPKAVTKEKLAEFTDDLPF